MYTKNFTGVFTAPATTTVFNKKKTPYKITPVQDSYKMPAEMQSIYNSAKAKSAYGATNPTNNQPSPVAPTYTPQPQQQQQQQQQNDYYGAYTDAINKQTQNAKSRYETQEQMAKNDTNLYNQQMERIYGQTAKTLKDQIPVLQERSQTTQDLIRKGLENVNQRGAMAKGNIEEQTGTTLRSQAQSKREVDSKRNAIFAGNNTTDSYGFGGYQMEQSNADNEFLREQNMTKRGRDQQLAGIDAQLVSAQTTAEMAINDEVAKFNDTVRQINNSLTMGEIEKKNAIENSYNNLEKTLFSIRDGYNTETASLYEKQLKLMQTVAEASSPDKTNKDADALRQEYIMRTEKSGFPEVYSAYNKIMSTSDSAAGDMSMIFAYMKLLDPQSVVREGEFATAQNSGSVPDAIRNTYNKALNGERLQPSQRTDFRKQAETIFGDYRKTQDQVDAYYGSQASSRNLDPYNVVGLYGNYQANRNSGQPSTQSSGNIIVAPDGQQVMIVD